MAASLAVHLLVLLALYQPWARPARRVTPGPVTTAVLVHLAPPLPPVARPEPRPVSASTAPPAASRAPGPRVVAAPVAAAPVATRVAATSGQLAAITGDTAPGEGSAQGPSDGEIAGAARAGSGGGGCDMIRLLQSALRRDRLVQAAVASARADRTIMVWNGDWVRRPDQDGAGLAAVREAMMWEIAFAPKPCSAQPVHGLVLISLGDGADGARLVLGASAWRWSDLLRAHGHGGAVQ